MKAARFLPPLLAGATLLLLCANALPSTHRRQVLRRERERLLRQLEEEETVGRRLRAEVEALRADPFYIERTLLETWRGVPRGAVPFDAPPGPGAQTLD